MSERGTYLRVNTRYYEVLGLTDDGLLIRRLEKNDWKAGEPTTYGYGRLDAVLSEHSAPTAFFFDSWCEVDTETETATDGGRNIVGPNDPPTSPQHECDCCGGAYYSRRAAIRCCGRVMTDGGQLTACPECDSARIRLVGAPSVQRGESRPERYLCYDCDTRFDEAVTRERRGDGGRRGLSKRLADADEGASWSEIARQGGGSA